MLDNDSSSPDYMCVCRRCKSKTTFKSKHIFVDFDMMGDEVFIIDCEFCGYEMVISYDPIYTI
jgi:hypothetical protein